MRRKRNGAELSLWQWAVLCVLYGNFTMRCVESGRGGGGLRFIYEIPFEGRVVRVCSATVASLIKRRLLNGTSLYLTPGGEGLISRLCEEEIEGYVDVFALHDLRYDKNGRARHVGDTR